MAYKKRNVNNFVCSEAYKIYENMIFVFVERDGLLRALTLIFPRFGK